IFCSSLSLHDALPICDPVRVSFGWFWCIYRSLLTQTLRSFVDHRFCSSRSVSSHSCPSIGGRLCLLLTKPPCFSLPVIAGGRKLSTRSPTQPFSSRLTLWHPTASLALARLYSTGSATSGGCASQMWIIRVTRTSQLFWAPVAAGLSTSPKGRTTKTLLSKSRTRSICACSTGRLLGAVFFCVAWATAVSR